MKHLINITTSAAAFVILIFFLLSTPLRAGVVLPDSGGFLVGDFTVFSLAEINVRAGFGSPQSGDPFAVASSPGALIGADAIVIATGTNNGQVNNNPDGMDDAYSTPSGITDATFTTNDATNDPSDGPDDLPDSLFSWDADVADLRDYLTDGGGEFVVYFNLNETGTDGLSGIDLLIFAEFTLTKADGTTAVFTLEDFFDDGTFNDWVETFGTICASMTEFFHDGPCDGSPSEGAGAQDINQNLGENLAAFAAFNQDLNDLIMDPGSGYLLLSINARMAELNDGYEQVFILSDTTTTPPPPPPPPPDVSEPHTLGVFLLGVMVLLFRFRIAKERNGK